jgi:hypothetical protein
MIDGTRVLVRDWLESSANPVVLEPALGLAKVSGTQRESVVLEAFKDLLKGWARSHDLVFVPEYEISAREGTPLRRSLCARVDSRPVLSFQ